MQTESHKHNYAFIDGQNLHIGTTQSEHSWKVDFKKFRIYLKYKYKVEKAFYYLGFMDPKYSHMYEKIRSAGFIVCFRKHNSAMMGEKKGNVDSDIVLDVMKKLYKKEDFDKVVIVSGDGDYRALVDFLIEENKFQKILLPNKKFASSLYKKIPSAFYENLDTDVVKNKIKKLGGSS